MPFYVEEIPCLNMGAARRLGLFRGNTLVLVTERDVMIKIEYVPAGSAIRITPAWFVPEKPGLVVSIAHREVGRHRARKRFFVCPESGALRTDLFVESTDIGCAKALGLVHASRNLYGQRYEREVKGPVQERQRAAEATAKGGVEAVARGVARKATTCRTQG